MESKLADESKKGHDVEKKDISSPNERLCSRNSSLSSSVQSSEFEEPLLADSVEIGTVLSKEGNLDDHPDDGQSILQSSTMEPPLDSCGSRISPYGFARNKSGNPMEWSINSNESLFSIQMGTTSFTRDQLNWVKKSQELNEEGGYQDLDSHQPLSCHDLNPSEDDISSVELSASPSEPANTHTSNDINNTGMTSTSTEPTTTNNAEDPRTELTAGNRGKGESEINRESNSANIKSSPIEEQTRHSAHCSDASGQSFAFPLLVGELDRGNSVKPADHTHQEELQEKTSQHDPPHKPSSSNTDHVQIETREAAKSSSWFSGCFFCCSSR